VPGAARHPSPQVTASRPALPRCHRSRRAPGPPAARPRTVFRLEGRPACSCSSRACWEAGSGPYSTRYHHSRRPWDRRCVTCQRFGGALTGLGQVVDRFLMVLPAGHSTKDACWEPTCQRVNGGAPRPPSPVVRALLGASFRLELAEQSFGPVRIPKVVDRFRFSAPLSLSTTYSIYYY
jgi:hypothetical protein